MTSLMQVLDQIDSLLQQLERGIATRDPVLEASADDTDILDALNAMCAQAISGAKASRVDAIPIDPSVATEWLGKPHSSNSSSDVL